MLARLSPLLALATFSMVAAQEALRFGVVSVSPSVVKAGEVRLKLRRKIQSNLTCQ